MRSFQLIFSYRKHNLFSSLIKWHQKAPFSHTAIKFYSNYMDLDLVYEATATGVNILPFNTWAAKGNVITAFSNFDASQEEMRTNLQKAFRKLGRPYGFSAITGIFFKSSNIGVDGQKAFICSELAADFLGQLLPDLGKPIDQITPNDLFKLVKER